MIKPNKDYIRVEFGEIQGLEKGKMSTKEPLEDRLKFLLGLKRGIP